MDLGTFYREFQNPPQLASLSLHISSQSMADDLVNLLLVIVVMWKILKKKKNFCIYVGSNGDLYSLVQDSLPEKLAVYEKNIDEFDAFVDMLQ